MSTAWLACDEKTQRTPRDAPAGRSSPIPGTALPTAPGTARPAAPGTALPTLGSAAAVPVKVEHEETAMATRVQFIAYTNASVNEASARRAIDLAIAEMRRLEALLSEWQETSEIGTLNRRAGDWVNVSPETFDVLEKGVWGGRLSEGTFDITFQSMSQLWKFGTARESTPRLPSAAEVARARALVDYRKLELDPEKRRARLPKGRAVGLGGIAKGYIVDRAAAVLTRAGLRSFLVRAGGDLYGSGRKPDGAPWVSAIQDPRGAPGDAFARLELEDHAFSTAGDYARFYVIDGKRYHHIIDPRTGYPATASRSVTVWAKDALTADVIDDAVFILGPEKGLALAESIDGVGVVIVDAKNKVWTSRRLEGKVVIAHAPTDGI